MDGKQHAVATQVFRTGKPWVGRFGEVAGCVLPLATRDRIVGTLCLRRRGDIVYTDDDVSFLTQVAHQVTIAVANALAYGEVHRLKERLAEERVYGEALRLLGVGREDVWMVGDHLEWDVLAPQRLGLTGIWIDREGAGLPQAHADARPHRIIGSLSELLE